MDDNFACLIFVEQVRAGVNYSRLNDRSCLNPHFVSVNKVKTYIFANFLYSLCYSQSLFFLLCEINENMKLNYRSAAHAPHRRFIRFVNNL